MKRQTRQEKQKYKRKEKKLRKKKRKKEENTKYIKGDIRKEMRFYKQTERRCNPK